MLFDSVHHLIHLVTFCIAISVSGLLISSVLSHSVELVDGDKLLQTLVHARWNIEAWTMYPRNVQRHGTPYYVMVGSTSMPSLLSEDDLHLATASPPIWRLFSFYKLYDIHILKARTVKEVGIHTPRNILITTVDESREYVHDEIMRRLKALLYEIRSFPNVSDHECRNLIIMGTDTRLSSPYVYPLLQQLHASGRFSKIWYEAKDVETDIVATVPMGFNSLYLLQSGLREIAAAMRKARNPQFIKCHLIVAAFGFMWNSSDDNRMSERIRASRYVAVNRFIQRVNWSPKEYWWKLAQYTFMFAPPGEGVQAPKFAEAWSVRTIPVTLAFPAFVDLKQLGFPLLLLDKWEQLNESTLHYYMHGTEYKTINWTLVDSLLSVDGWKQTVMCDCLLHPEDANDREPLNGFHPWSC